MTRRFTCGWLLFSLLVCVAGWSSAQDIREAARKAAADRAAAEQRARAVEAEILADRTKLLAEVQALEARQRELDAAIAALGQRAALLEARREKLSDEWARRELGFREISGNVIVVARDLEAMLRTSPLSVGDPERLKKIEPLLQSGYFPGLDDISRMAGLFLDEIERSGQVRLYEGAFVNRGGEDTRGQILSLGKFTAIYREGGEVGFLNFSPDGQRFFALANLPPRRMGHQLREYLAGKSALVPIDLAGGAALRQVSKTQSLAEHVTSGGPVVWPILALGAVGVLLVVYKAIFLRRVHGNTDRIMADVHQMAESGDWAACRAVVEQRNRQKWPVVAVIKAGLAHRQESREALESVLQESILHELPRVQRGLSTLAIIAAIAPLLGLLGTVTGMIEVFRVITLHGTGDPRLMSGGISEALVTTELGLAVAIPFMLAHTFLSRKVDHVVGDMEKNAVRLTNIIQKERTRRRASSLQAMEACS